MPALFPVPYTRNTADILFHSPNALSSLFFLLPVLVPGHHPGYYVLMGVLTTASFVWWRFQLKSAQILDLACITSIGIYPSVRHSHYVLSALVSMFTITSVLAYSEFHYGLQVLIVAVLLTALWNCIKRKKYASAVSLAIALGFKGLDMHGIMPYGTALFHVMIAVTLCLTF